MTVGGKEPEEYKEIRKNFDEAARNEGKDPSKMPKPIELNVAYTDDTDVAIECQKKYWAGNNPDKPGRGTYPVCLSAW